MIEHQRAAEGSAQWYDAEAGPLVRPYARTGARGRENAAAGAPRGAYASGCVGDLADEPGGGGGADRAGDPGGPHADLVAQVSAVVDAEAPEPVLLSSAHRTLLGLCRAEPQTVADLAAASDLPTGVVRDLVDDLARAGQVAWADPAGLPARLPVQEVIDGLRAL
ncbi:DUF742 domain-containing protein [Streptomyces sp. NPDC004111]|uniref:DUF742 domain-containing protein n=1 Tax=Streptomyces sp. NPDC004111 TaxID=3364690 RepID=UPI0036CB06CD